MPAIQGTSHFEGCGSGRIRVSTLNNENKTAEETSILSRLDDSLAIVCILVNSGLLVKNLFDGLTGKA